MSLPVRGKRPTLSDAKYYDGEPNRDRKSTALNQEQRQDARHAAHDAVMRAVGARPSRDQFTHHATSQYPPTVTRLISILCLILLLAAFTPSAIRLYVIGSHTFGQAVSSSVAMTCGGRMIHPLPDFPSQLV